VERAAASEGPWGYVGTWCRTVPVHGRAAGGAKLLVLRVMAVERGLLLGSSNVAIASGQ